jgi:DHA1 family multidrug resistance protein-like MFS transporter
MAFVQSAEQLVALRMAQGFITGVVGAANALVAATVPRERMGYAMGLMQVAVGIGLGVGPMIGGAVADAFGYDAAFFVTGAMLAVAGVIVVIGVEERFTARPATPGKRAGIWTDYRAIFRKPGIPTIYSLGFMNQLGRMIYVPVLPLFVLTLLDSPGQVNSFTGVMIGLSSAATALFSVFLGRRGDRLGHRRVFIASAAACALFFVLQSMALNSRQLLLTQIVTGIALGGVVPSISALLAQYTRIGQEGAVYGLNNSINSAARALGPMVGVAISGLLGLRAVFQSTALLYLATAVAAALLLPRSATVRSKGRTQDKA